MTTRSLSSITRNTRPLTGARTRTVSVAPICPVALPGLSGHFDGDQRGLRDFDLRSGRAGAVICGLDLLLAGQSRRCGRARIPGARCRPFRSVSRRAPVHARPDSQPARVCSTTASASCFNCSAVATRAFASASWRGSSGAIGSGSMRAITSSRLTRVAAMKIDSRQPARHRGGDDKTIPRARLSFSINRHAHRPTPDARDLHSDGRRAQRDGAGDACHAKRRDQKRYS